MFGLPLVLPDERKVDFLQGAMPAVKGAGITLV
jgi:hypothetical protein